MADETMTDEQILEGVEHKSFAATSDRTAASMSSRSVKSLAKVRSLLTDLTSRSSSRLVTSEISRPSARWRMRSPLTPKIEVNVDSGARESSPSV